MASPSMHEVNDCDQFADDFHLLFQRKFIPKWIERTKSGNFILDFGCIIRNPHPLYSYWDELERNLIGQASINHI
jgi:hypothetical protein